MLKPYFMLWLQHGLWVYYCKFLDLSLCVGGANSGRLISKWSPSDPSLWLDSMNQGGACYFTSGEMIYWYIHVSICFAVIIVHDIPQHPVYTAENTWGKLLVMMYLYDVSIDGSAYLERLYLLPSRSRSYQTRMIIDDFRQWTPSWFKI